LASPRFLRFTLALCGIDSRPCGTGPLAGTRHQEKSREKHRHRTRRELDAESLGWQNFNHGNERFQPQTLDQLPGGPKAISCQLAGLPRGNLPPGHEDADLTGKFDPQPRMIPSFEDRLHACWTGKNLGGAVGMPFEGCPGPCWDAASPGVPPITPNDDVEMQLLALAAVEETGNWPEAAQMARLWQRHMAFAPDEYGVALRNLSLGFLPPESGRHDNWFRHGMGAVIRTEIWAGLRPADPKSAAILAANDASIDHADEGVHGAAFLAALQSHAFSGAPMDACADAAQSILPPSSVFRQVLDEARQTALAESDADGIRRIRNLFGHPNFTDCVMNLAFILFVLFRGQGNLRHSLHLALQCGEDADCTCASVGATLGILHGPALFDGWPAIPDTLAINPNFAAIQPPATITELCRRISAASQRLRDRQPLPWSPGHTGSPAEQHWIIHPADSVEDFPIELAAALNGNSPRPPVCFPAAFICLKPFCQPPPVALHLVTRLQVPEEFHGWLLVAADGGTTTWLDGELLTNYHGRRTMVPAFHRTEGGTTVFVHLSPGEYRLHVRILYPQPPFGFCVQTATRDIHPTTRILFRS